MFYKNCHRHPKTTQERRKAAEGKDWSEYGRVKIRARRNFANLPNTYDDINIRHQKTWKKKRSTQHREAGLRRDENRHERVFPYIQYCRGDWRALYRFTDYLEQNDIPFREEQIRLGKWEWSWAYGQWMYRSRLVATLVIWWSKKEIE